MYDDSLLESAAGKEFKIMDLMTVYANEELATLLTGTDADYWNIYQKDAGAGGFYGVYVSPIAFDDGTGVPEPGTWVMLAMGLAATGVWRRNRR